MVDGMLDHLEENLDEGHLIIHYAETTPEPPTGVQAVDPLLCRETQASSSVVPRRLSRMDI
jgi:hypothetical protein